MKVNWDYSDIKPGRHVWLDKECIIGADPYDHRAPCVLMVLDTGYIMKIGTKDELAEYMTKQGYRPTKET